MKGGWDHKKAESTRDPGRIYEDFAEKQSGKPKAKGQMLLFCNEHSTYIILYHLISSYIILYHLISSYIILYHLISI